MVPWRTLTHTLATFGLLVANAGWAGAAPTDQCVLRVVSGESRPRQCERDLQGRQAPPRRRR